MQKHVINSLQSKYPPPIYILAYGLIIKLAYVACFYIVCLCLESVLNTLSLSSQVLNLYPSKGITKFISLVARRTQTIASFYLTFNFVGA